MLCWAFKANFANLNRRATAENSFNEMPAKRARSESKSVTHVYAHCVTHVYARCREGELFLTEWMLLREHDNNPLPRSTRLR